MNQFWKIESSSELLTTSRRRRVSGREILALVLDLGLGFPTRSVAMIIHDNAALSHYAYFCYAFFAIMLGTVESPQTESDCQLLFLSDSSLARMDLQTGR
jgi:hypothetical protein